MFANRFKRDLVLCTIHLSRKKIAGTVKHTQAVDDQEPLQVKTPVIRSSFAAQSSPQILCWLTVFFQNERFGGGYVNTLTQVYLSTTRSSFAAGSSLPVLFRLTPFFQTLFLRDKRLAGGYVNTLLHFAVLTLHGSTRRYWKTSHQSI